MLEIILLIIVVIIAFVGVSWISHQRSQERARAFERELDFDEARDNDAFQERFDALFEQESRDRVDVDISAYSAEREPDLFDDYSEPESELPKFDAAAALEDEVQEEAEPEWDMVVAFTIMAPAQSVFTGRAIKATLEKQDLHFGDMQIYHKYTVGRQKQTLFSAANILAPGTLLPNQFVSMTTPGLLLFARFPGPVSEMALFDDLLDTAYAMAEDLDGILCDEARQPITDEALEAIRTRIFAYQTTAQTTNSNSNDYLD